MKIRTRLSLQFIILFAILLSTVLISVYFVVAKHWNNNFFKQLEDRAITVGHNYLAEDNFTKAEFDEVIRKFPRTLPQEQIRIYTSDFIPTYIAEEDLKWSKSLLQSVVEKKRIQFKQGNSFVVGIYYKDNSGNYIIVAKATNTNGAFALQQLKTVMFISLLVALLITFILSRYFSNSFLRPIKSIINNIQHKNITTLVHPIPTEGMSKDEIKTLSENINKLCERLHESFDNQQSFISHASHELKTPIASMLGNAEIALRQPRSSQEYQEVLEGVVTDAIRINQIISNLLAISQLDSAVYPLQFTTFEPFWWNMIDHLVTHQSQLNLNLNIATEEDLSHLYFDGNGNLLELALSNIILNAHKFSFEKPIKLTLLTTSTHIIIEVKDQGIGINKEDIEKLTLPFYRSNNALGIDGTGLGLSLSSKILQLHKGKLTIESELNVGTTVSIHIPKSNSH
ncbi:MAG: HAMP domain-containing histidine kinase [Flavobacteriaceae bacterium]|jgi:signal transduction histidine kinase|nr:HAMP domain-containing histidine kinase [Flavobacteriaceae bacterium]